eukprot:375715-Hanusia_phi.AAC.1
MVRHGCAAPGGLAVPAPRAPLSQWPGGRTARWHREGTGRYGRGPDTGLSLRRPPESLGSRP